MEEYKDLMSEDEIRIIGYTDSEAEAYPDVSSLESSPKRWHRGGLKYILILISILIVAVIVVLSLLPNEEVDEEPALFEAVEEKMVEEVAPLRRIGRVVNEDAGGFCEIKDTVINDIPLLIYIPHNAEMSLHLGRPNRGDASVVYMAQAADVRADNGGIVGAFVLKGRPLAWGLSKMGYCASINGVVSVGVAKNSPLFEEATEQGGYFFRQYPLVSNREVVENNPKGKSVRRGICDRNGEIFMVQSVTDESFHDFSLALVDLGVDHAVYLVGSSAIGLAVDENGVCHEWGNSEIYTRGRHQMPRNTSYIVWKKK